jgi:hypothetical protein
VCVDGAVRVDGAVSHSPAGDPAGDPAGEEVGR